MKIFLKKYGVIILTIILLFTISMKEFLNQKKLYDDRRERAEIEQKMCEDGTSPWSPSYCENKSYWQLAFVYDTTTTFHMILRNHGGIFAHEMMIPFLIIVMTTYWFHQKLKSGYFKSELLRLKYTDFLKNNYKRVLKISLISPCLLLFLYFLSWLISDGFDVSKTLTAFPTLSTIDPRYISKVPEFLMTVLVNSYLLSIFYGNLALLTAKKNKNMILSVISAYFLYLIIAFVLELVIPRIIYELFNISFYHHLSIFNFYAYYKPPSLVFMFVFALVLAFVSFIVVHLSYRDKEALIIENEK